MVQCGLLSSGGVPGDGNLVVQCRLLSSGGVPGDGSVVVQCRLLSSGGVPGDGTLVVQCGLLCSGGPPGRREVATVPTMLLQSEIRRVSGEETFCSEQLYTIDTDKLWRDRQ